MRIEAATLAGGKVNQDYYAYGETYALVLDGASSFLPESTSVGTDTYVRALGEALAEKLEFCDLTEIPEVVAASIDQVAGKYELVEDESPNSTVVIAKWNHKEIAMYVLGDSSCLLINTFDEIRELSDTRISEFGENIRIEYKNRLKSGSGFDAYHKNLLKKLQECQKKYRNTKGGYWIAGADKKSAYQGVQNFYRLSDLKGIILSSDGGLLSLSKQNSLELLNKNSKEMLDILLMQNEWEAQDKYGILCPRSKLHDDKTILLLKTECVENIRIGDD